MGCSVETIQYNTIGILVDEGNKRENEKQVEKCHITRPIVSRGKKMIGFKTLGAGWRANATYR
jgi:hypothetical protein